MVKMSKKELVKRYAVFIVSLFVMAIGVAMTKKAELEVSPISSVANVMSIQFTSLSIGNWLSIWNCVLILGQILFSEKSFSLSSLCKYLFHSSLVILPISECGLCLFLIQIHMPLK